MTTIYYVKRVTCEAEIASLPSSQHYFPFVQLGKECKHAWSGPLLQRAHTFHWHSTHLLQTVLKVPTTYFEIYTTLKTHAYPTGNWYRPARKKVDQKTVLHSPTTRGKPACIARPKAIFVNHLYTKIYTLPAICPRAASEPTFNSQCGHPP